MAAYLDDERKEVLLEIVEYLNANYVHYGRAVAYLEQLAGVRAMPRNPATQLHVFLVPQAGIQRGAIVLGNLEPHTLHTMRVTFHRYHWLIMVTLGKNVDDFVAEIKNPGLWSMWGTSTLYPLI